MRRDIVRALRLIGEGHAKLSTDGTLLLGSPEAASLRMPAAAVSAMVSEGLMLRVRDHVRRTGEGRAFLRRALATASEAPFAEQHRERVARRIDDGGAVVEASVNAAENPLSWLATRKGKDGKRLVSCEQFEAGRRLAEDHERGHRRDRITQSWDASGVRSEARRDGLTVREAACAARRRVETALHAVGPGLADVLVAVCCEELGLEAAEKRLGWPARSGKVVLRLALDRLAMHYGLTGVAAGGPAPMVHWGAEDYRPHA